MFLKKAHLIIQLILFPLICGSHIEAAPIPLSAGWWENQSATNILTEARTITDNLSYFQGSKAHLLNQPNSSIEYFQRRMPNGAIETKSVYFLGKATMTVYVTQSGRYFWQNGRLIKTEYEDNQIESALAAKYDHPYNYQLLKTETVGTNDCLVIARRTTPRFLQVLKAALYPKYNPANPGPLGDPINFLRSETDTFIRKDDGVIIGEVQKNNSGDILNDSLYDVVQIDSPISDAEFVLPNISVDIATNTAQLIHIISQEKHAYGSLTPREIKRIRYVTTGIMIVSLGILLTLLYLRFRHASPN